jgi:hypothetical protein
MQTQQFFEQGQEPLIRIISSTPNMWYRNKIGQTFHVSTIDPNDGGWYAVTEFEGSVKMSDAEFGENIGKKDLTEELTAQQERITEQKQVEEARVKSEPPVSNHIPESIRHLKPVEIEEQPSIHPPFVRPRVEYDWDTDLITEDLFIIYTDSDGNVHKGFVEYVESDTIVMRDKTGKEIHIEMVQYIEETISVSFPEL